MYTSKMAQMKKNYVTFQIPRTSVSVNTLKSKDQTGLHKYEYEDNPKTKLLTAAFFLVKIENINIVEGEYIKFDYGLL